METTIKTKRETRVLPLVISGALATLAILCFVLHLSPKQVASALSEFARHHYFLTGFILLVLALAAVKYYGFEVGSGRSSADLGAQRISGRSKRRMRIMLQNIKRTIDPYRDEKESLFVNKDGLGNLKFQDQEVLDDPSQREKRRVDLQTALSLGNLYKQKVIICFKEDISSLKKHTLATIWHVDDENVCVKGGHVIPVKSIYKIEL